MEPLIPPTTPGEQVFTDTQCFIADYASEVGLFSADGCSPAHFTDSVELLGGPGDLGDIFCWNDSIDHCIAYLNKELVALGIPALYKDDGSGDGTERGFDLLALVNSACRLLNLYQGVSSKLGDMEAEEMRQTGELDYLRTRHGKLKNQVEACEREIAAVQSKEQQLQSKNKQLNSMLKGEKDEITKLLSALANQKSQHIHEMKRKEQELIRLKEKMSQLVNDKKDKRGTIEVLNALPRADGKRGTWKTGKSLGRKEEELYRTQLAKQERREQGLALENTHLKQLLNQVGQDIEQLLGTDRGSAQGTELSCPYRAFQEQWCSLRNSIKTVGGQAVYLANSCVSKGGRQNPVISITDHDKEIMKLKEEIEESRVLIALQQQCFQEQLTAASSSELPAHLKGSYFLEEQQRLQEEQDMFEEQKQAFEVERKNFTEAAIRLGRERKQFEERKALFLQQGFLCSLPGLDMRKPTRRLSAPVAVRRQDEHLLKLRTWNKPICSPYPKVILTPCRTPVEIFRNKQLASNPNSPIMCRQQLLFSDDWPASPAQLSQSKGIHQDTACQTEMPVKGDLQGDFLEHFLDSFC
ncbi:afadin- and alpha-actinin-binding protein-like [Rhineura floridana]|uniref:afadin- and alpha-actinin-binding protein-like n=1 Tax=Rhineura floridana TaxID=261503 RepID=UPI002AC83D85|nr:afadin- and alpha-actinin-binding protein-like [Rhineura floridana]XP_061469863.1 afadin- and alpha-actinin-binding protein-like [Rhineura floridana]XP_061469865.1 afadin- and alpha-actinin-binding protein-like [Rhineura floridana]XP_061469866.1 afadin- and alpha-actinin-binding protein-like [Rhineura floridana]XP_061469867.1 afadin- and alpha-actinin-binding protein-like [Rhineura floridana]